MTKSLVRKLSPMVLLMVPFLYLIFAAPFGEPAQTILEVSYLCVIFGIVVWESRRNADEVEIAAARFITAIGAYAGIACTVGFLIVMTRSTAVADFIASLAESPANDLPPAAVGFGLGAMTVITLMFLCAIIAYAAWSWRAARPQA
ncbi:MAG: hypothetical protein QNJ40_15635 [Xanthomonadales bacterium]|nr:hypothetical protein [Xanthomonadales bacterium]